MTTDAKLEEIRAQIEALTNDLIPLDDSDKFKWNTAFLRRVLRSMEWMFSHIETLQQERGNREEQIEIHVEQVRQMQLHLASLERVREAARVLGETEAGSEAEREAFEMLHDERKRHDREWPKEKTDD